ncbi:MAG: hypothetical protein ACAH88_08475, partial [Roseimicrobium sp.]
TTSTDPLDADTNDNGYTDLEDHLALIAPTGDYDADGITNDVDPYPVSAANTSSVNNISWYGNALGDEDSDSIPNWNDSEPYPPANDADGDGIENSLDPYPYDNTNYSSTNNTYWYGAVLQDNDGDLLLNWQDPVPDDPDQDGDGLYLSQETALGTSDTDVDSDDDGLTDYEEAVVYQSSGVSPTNAHTLSAQYTDWYMVDTTDSDGGGIPNRIEQFYGMNPSDAWDDLEGDLDGDGVNNYSAYSSGLNLGAQFASRYDRDEDGMTDVWEVTHGFNVDDPTDACDDADGDYVFNVEEYGHNLDPHNADTDNNGGNGDDFVAAFQVTSASLNLSATDVGADGREYNDDWDSDSHANRAEVLAGSDPRDADSLPVSSGAPSGSAPTVAFPANGSGSNGGGNPGSSASIDPLAAGDVKGFTLNSTQLPTPGSQNETWEVAGGVVFHEKVLQRDSQNNVTTSESWTERFSDPNGPSDYWNFIRFSEPYQSDYLSPIPSGMWVENVELAGLGSYSMYGRISESYTYEEIIAGQSEEREYFRLFTGAPVPQNVLSTWKVHTTVNHRGYLEYRLLVEGGAQFPITKRFRIQRTVFDAYMPFQYIVDRDFIGDIVELHVAEDSENSGSIVLELGSEDYALDHRYNVGYELVPFDNGEDAPFTLSSNDGAGPKYRKVGLNGVPMADEKPQVQDESGENPEETYIDAYNRQLRHSVSDVYASVESSLLPLTVRRDVSPEAWTERSGLRPLERPDRAFGMGWTSNLTPHIRIENGTRAVVTDEQGSTSVFVRTPPYWEDDPVLGPQYVATPWIHTRQEKQHGKTQFDTLEEEVVNSVRTFKLTKKFGTTCFYGGVVFAQQFPRDRVLGSNQRETYQYARLMEVKDRLGNRLQYTYPQGGGGSTLATLIPNVISDPDRPAMKLWIEQDDGLVTKVKGPAGELITYAYGSEGQGALLAPVLESVTRGGNTVGYDYDLGVEEDPTPDPEYPAQTPATLHLEVSRIIDERNNDYEFEYALNHAQTFVQQSGGNLLTRVQTGLPRLLTKVTLPDNSFTTFGGTRTVGLTMAGVPVANASVQTIVSRGTGTYTYLFTTPDVFVPLLPDPGEEDNASRTLTMTFKNFSLTSSAGTESYVLKPEAGMALASATDVSGNTTEFFYADVWEGTDGQSGYFDDPTSQRNALLGVKTFTYDASTRVLKSVTDERGTETEYTIQPVTGLRTQERVIDAQSNTLRVTDFEYNDLNFAGFLTKRTIVSNTSALGDMVTEYVADDNGRVLDEIVQAGNNLELITSYTYTGNGSKKTVQDAKGYVTTFEYEPGTQRLKKVIHPDATFKELSYDAHGNVLWERDESGLKTFHEYDVLNRRLKTTVDLNGNGVANARYSG